MDAVSWGIGLGATSLGIGAYGSYAQAQAQNVTIRQGYAAQQQAIRAENRMIRDQETLEAKKAISRSRLIEGRIRVSAGESGLGLGGTYDALLRQADYDSYLNQQVIEQNANNAFAARSVMQPLGGSEAIPIMSGILSGIGGFDTGLRIGSLLKG